MDQSLLPGAAIRLLNDHLGRKPVVEQPTFCHQLITAWQGSSQPAALRSPLSLNHQWYGIGVLLPRLPARLTGQPCLTPTAPA